MENIENPVIYNVKIEELKSTENTDLNNENKLPISIENLNNNNNLNNYEVVTDKKDTKQIKVESINSIHNNNEVIDNE